MHSRIEERAMSRWRHRFVIQPVSVTQVSAAYQFGPAIGQAAFIQLPGTAKEGAK
jgi:hypothetical protein